jgi:hypothetical protein
MSVGLESSVLTLTLTAEEREHLLNYLDQALRETRVEAHRTDSPNYRTWVESRESALQSVIAKLRGP